METLCGELVILEILESKAIWARDSGAQGMEVGEIPYHVSRTVPL
jgi:hypothetical protein